MKRDIECKDDIKLLVDHFYQKVKDDPLLGYVFNDLAKVNWSHHLSVMYNFWENIILHTGTYDENPVNLHEHLRHIAPISLMHFDQWNKLFVEAVNKLFKGKNAQLAISRALNISTILQEKILGSQDSENIY